MPLAPICILYCKQCITVNEYRICWFSQFGFLGEKYLCNVCIFHCDAGASQASTSEGQLDTHQCTF
jgi:hypothetical protein